MGKANPILLAEPYAMFGRIPYSPLRDQSTRHRHRSISHPGTGFPDQMIYSPPGSPRRSSRRDFTYFRYLPKIRSETGHSVSCACTKYITLNVSLPVTGRINGIGRSTKYPKQVGVSHERSKQCLFFLGGKQRGGRRKVWGGGYPPHGMNGKLASSGKFLFKDDSRL